MYSYFEHVQTEDAKNKQSKYLINTPRYLPNRPGQGTWVKTRARQQVAILSQHDASPCGISGCWATLSWRHPSAIARESLCQTTQTKSNQSLSSVEVAVRVTLAQRSAHTACGLPCLNRIWFWCSMKDTISERWVLGLWICLRIILLRMAFCHDSWRVPVLWSYSVCNACP